jgi:hypothetical protein
MDPWLNDMIVWMNGLSLGVAVRRSLWAIPALATVHILAIGMVLSSVIMIDLRVWGVSRSQTLVQSAKRFTPWLWVGMVLLVVSGLGLTISQARRTLLDPSFHIKMVLMMVAIFVTVGFQVAVVRKSAEWSADQRSRLAAGLLAAVTLILWIAVTLAGRGRWMGTFFSIR